MIFMKSYVWLIIIIEESFFGKLFPFFILSCNKGFLDNLLHIWVPVFIDLLDHIHKLILLCPLFSFNLFLFLCFMELYINKMLRYLF